MSPSPRTTGQLAGAPVLPAAPRPSLHDGRDDGRPREPRLRSGRDGSGADVDDLEAAAAGAGYVGVGTTRLHPVERLVAEQVEALLAVGCV